jgi:hypothetical protein
MEDWRDCYVSSKGNSTEQHPTSQSSPVFWMYQPTTDPQKQIVNFYASVET